MNFSQKFKYCPVCGSDSFVPHKIKSMHCEKCGFIYYVNPSAATAAFIRNEDGDLLVCRRSHEPAKGTLDLPGGFIDYNETAEGGVAREVHEEIGLNIDHFRYVFSLPNDYIYSDLDIPTMDLFFEGKVKNGIQIQAADDVAESFFIPVRELNPELFGLKSIRQAIKMFISAHENERKENFLA